MLIDQHANASPIANQLAGLDETFLALKQLQPEPRPIAAHLGIDIPVAECLEDRPKPALPDDRRELGEQLPVPNMADDHDKPLGQNAIRAQLLEALDGHQRLDLRA